MSPSSPTAAAAQPLTILFFLVILLAVLFPAAVCLSNSTSSSAVSSAALNLRPRLAPRHLLLKTSPSNATLTSSVLRQAKACRRFSCNQCTRTCPNFATLGADLGKCETYLKVAKSVNPRRAESDCRLEACAPLMLGDLCELPMYRNLHQGLSNEVYPIGSFRGRSNEEVLSILRTQTAEYRRREQLYKDETEKLLASGSSSLSSSDTSAMSAKAQEIHKQFTEALAMRARLNYLRRKIRGKKFRKHRLTIMQLRLEQMERKAYSKFWETHRMAYKSALKSSRLAVRQLRDAMHGEYLMYVKEVTDLQRLRGGNANREKEAVRLVENMEQTKIDRDYYLTLTAQIRGQTLFLVEAREDLLALLSNIRENLRQRRLEVPCGPLALSDILTKSMLEA